MVQSGSDNLFTEKRLKRAVSFVSDYWMPVNPELLDNIKNGLRSGSFDNDLASLVADLRKDIGLFFFCLQRLCKVLSSAGVELPERLSVVELLESCGIDVLTEILETKISQISPHSMQGAESFQIGRYQELMLSAATAQTLAPGYGIDQDSAFSAAVIRQLGHALIAWNYPKIYREAILELKHNSEFKFDLILSKRLGFSPQLLACRILASWGVQESSLGDFGLDSEENELEDEAWDSVGFTLARLCRVGEALARANNPEIYPSATQDMGLAKAEIEAQLGEHGLDLILDKYKEQAESYLAFTPEMFSTSPLLEQISGSEDQSVNKVKLLERRNPYLFSCSADLQRELKSLYGFLNLGSNQQEQLRKYVREVVPHSSFSGGVAFTLDPAMMLLLPQLRIGEIKLREFEAVDYSMVLSNKDPVSVAFQGSEPIVQFGRCREGQDLTAVSGVFGKSDRVGVLYLEKPGVNTSSQDKEMLIEFKALCLALEDALGLE